VLQLVFNILLPPVIPHTINIRNLFENSNSNGCPIVAYKIIKVNDNLTNNTLTEKEYTNLISLNTATGILNIFKFNQPLDYNLFLSASFDGINWLSMDSKNTRNIRLVIQEDRKSLLTIQVV
jgi:hypothetical protein